MTGPRPSGPRGDVERDVDRTVDGNGRSDGASGGLDALGRGATGGNGSAGGNGNGNGNGSAAHVVAGPVMKPTATTVSPEAQSATDARPASAVQAPERPDPSVQPPPYQPEPAQSGGAPAWGLPLAVLILGMFMSILDTSIVNIAIANIRKDFGATIENAQWISTAYALTEGAVVPISAWLGNRLGHKRLYVGSVALFTVFSALCGISGSLFEMIIWRICQAIPGGMIPVTCLTLIYKMVPREKIGAAMGMFGLGVVVAPGIGPTLGGYFVEYLSWPWIYWVNVPVGIFAVFAALAVLPNDKGERGRRFDALGFACIAGGLFLFLLALEKGSTWGWTGYRVLGLLIVATNLFLAWVIVELQVANPMLNLRVFRNPTFLKTCTIQSFLFVGLFAMLFYLPQFLQNVQQRTPSHTGLIVLPQALMLMVLMPMAGLIYDRIGARWPATIGMAVAGTGLFVLSGINTDMPVSSVILGECLVAGGMGIGMMPTMTAGLSGLSPELGDSGSAIQTLVQRVSQAFGTALLTAMITVDNVGNFANNSSLVNSQGATADPRVQGYVDNGAGQLSGYWQQINNKAITESYSKAFLIASGLVYLGVIVALWLPNGRPAGNQQAAAL